jgi:hypothetical protein
VVEWQGNQHFENHLCSCHKFPDDKNRDGSQNGLLAIQPRDEVLLTSVAVKALDFVSRISV